LWTPHACTHPKPPAHQASTISSIHQLVASSRHQYGWGCFGPETNIVGIIYFCFLHSQGGRLYNDSTISQVLWVELWLQNGFMPSMLIENRMLLASSNHGKWVLMLPHCAASARCLNLPSFL
jgi:hypothetical protein